MLFIIRFKLCAPDVNPAVATIKLLVAMIFACRVPEEYDDDVSIELGDWEGLIGGMDDMGTGLGCAFKRAAEGVAELMEGRAGGP